MASSEIPPFSPDGCWYWDGSRWLSAPVPPQEWRWNGSRWVRRSKFPDRLRGLPKWLKWSFGAWAPFLVAWIPAVTTVASHHDSRELVAIVAVVLGGLAVLSTIAFGGVLGYRRAWGYLCWSILFGTAIVHGHEEVPTGGHQKYPPLGADVQVLASVDRSPF